jgi:hypothetical protein
VDINKATASWDDDSVGVLTKKTEQVRACGPGLDDSIC